MSIHATKPRQAATLDVGGMNDGAEQQAQCIYEKMAFLALDLFACIIAMRIDAGPPCIFQLPADAKPEGLSVDGSPQPPRAIEPVTKQGAPPTS